MREERGKSESCEERSVVCIGASLRTVARFARFAYCIASAYVLYIYIYMWQHSVYMHGRTTILFRENTNAACTLIYFPPFIFPFFSSLYILSHDDIVWLIKVDICLLEIHFIEKLLLNCLREMSREVLTNKLIQIRGTLMYLKRESVIIYVYIYTYIWQVQIPSGNISHNLIGTSSRHYY